MSGGLLKPVLAGAGAAVAIGMLGNLATELGPWYRTLSFPAWQPPDWLFGPVWTLIYVLTTWAGVAAWRRAPDRATRRNWLALLALNAFLNVLWSLLFFRLQRPDWALVEVVVLWLSVLSLAVYPWRWCRRAAWLLLPYLAWVAFAGVLNLAIVRLNAPFG